MAKKLDNNNGLLQKLWNTKAVIPVAAMALIFPISNLNATEISETTNLRNTIAQTNGAQTDQPGQTQQPAQTQQEGPATADDVVERAEDYIGQTITIRGDFIEAVDENGFTITPDRVFEADPILIVNVTGTPLDLPDQDGRVQATGDIREFSLDEVAQEYNIELDRATYALYEGSPVMIARSIAPAPGPGEVTGNPDQYFNRQIAVEADISNNYSPQVFILDDELPVININPEHDQRQQVQATDTTAQTQAQVDDTTEQPQAQDTETNGQRVVVTGQVRPFNEVQNELATLDPEVRAQLEENYADRPVLLSDGVYLFPREDRANNTY